MRRSGKQAGVFKVIVSWFGMALLLCALAPHFHHADDGQICAAGGGHTEDTERREGCAGEERERCEGEEHEGCVGAGHTVAFSQRETLGESLPEVAVLALLSVYAVGVDYDLALGGGVGVVSGEGVYVGTLHSRWVVVSSGLRAPPVIC